MQEDFRHIYWLGGSPCSGKSAAADWLAARLGWQVYHCDSVFDAHVQRAEPARHPWLSRIPGLVWDDFWMRPINLQVRNVVEAYAEEFPMILDDLRQFPTDRPALAEGTALLPELVEPVLFDARHAIWMIPTRAFQEAHYRASRPWVEGILSECRQPEVAFSRWMNRDAVTADHVRREAALRGLRVLIVDGSRTVAENAQMIAEHYTGEARS